MLSQEHVERLQGFEARRCPRQPMIVARELDDLHGVPAAVSARSMARLCSTGTTVSSAKAASSVGAAGGAWARVADQEHKTSKATRHRRIMAASFP